MGKTSTKTRFLGRRSAAERVAQEIDSVEPGGLHGNLQSWLPKVPPQETETQTRIDQLMGEFNRLFASSNYKMSAESKQKLAKLRTLQRRDADRRELVFSQKFGLPIDANARAVLKH